MDYLYRQLTAPTTCNNFIRSFMIQTVLLHFEANPICPWSYIWPAALQPWSSDLRYAYRIPGCLVARWRVALVLVVWTGHCPVSLYTSPTINCCSCANYFWTSFLQHVKLSVIITGHFMFLEQTSRKVQHSLDKHEWSKNVHFTFIWATEINI